jgi:prevent-host-death family protein
MVMAPRTVTATHFKAHCLALLDDVAASRRPLVVTKHGKPVARVVAVEEEPSLLGSVSLPAHDEQLFSTGEAWDADGP